MAKWKCEICNTEFENFEARGFNHTIYCPLCYYKKLYNQQSEVLDKIEEYLNKVELGELENGKAYTFKDFLKEEKDAEIEEAKWLLELLEETE